MTATVTPVPGPLDPQRGARRIALIYIGIGLLWITLSDSLFQAIAAREHVGYWLLTVKGYCYVLVTGYLLYLAIARLQVQHRAMQSQLARSEQAYRALFDSNPNPLWVCDPESSQFLAVNQAALTQYGYDRDELLAMSLADICPPEAQPDLEQMKRAMRHLGDVPVTQCLRIRMKSGQIKWVELTGNSLQFNQRDAHLLLALDIGERAAAERELVESRLRLHEAQRIAGLGYWTLDETSGEITCSEQTYAILGIANALPLSREQLLSIIHPDDRETLLSAWRQAWQGQPIDIELRVVRATDALGYLSLRAELVEHAFDSGKKLVGTVLDITTQKSIEQRLHESEQQYRQLIELMPEAVLIYRDGRVIFSNPAAAKLFCAPRPEDLLGLAIEDYIAPEHKAKALARMRALMSGANSVDIGFQERQLKKYNGELFSAEVAAQLVFIAGQKCIQVLVRDISVQKQTQRVLKSANERLLRLSTRAIEVGESERSELSRELHDDIGQLLTFIKMTSAWLQKRIDAGDINERVALINNVAGEALEKVRNMALTLRPAQLDTRGLKASIENHLQKYLSGDEIHYTVLGEELLPRPHPAVELGLFRVFQEALTNIIRHSGARHVEIELLPTAAAVSLRIVDDGCGFDVRTAQSVDVTLGLHTMSERIEQLGGVLQLRALPGVGTEVIATVPLEREVA